MNIDSLFDSVLQQYSWVSQEQAEEILDFFRFLLEENQKVNLSGYDSLDKMIQHYLLDALELYERIDENIHRMIDVGTGAGVPGLLLALLDEHRSFWLLDSVKKKTDFIQRALEYLHKKNVTVIHGRAEDEAHKENLREFFDCATAKAVGTLPVVLEYCAGFVKMGGRILLPRGEEKTEILPEHWKSTLGLVLEKKEPYHLEGRKRAYSLYHFKKMDATGDKYPRTPKKIRLHPL